MSKTLNKPKNKPALPDGVKVVPAPKNASRRALMNDRDITTSGGCRTVRTNAEAR